MDEYEPTKILRFEKKSPDKTVRCSAHLFDDGSVHLLGDEIEMIFEFAPNSVERAIIHMENLGYVRTS